MVLPSHIIAIGDGIHDKNYQEKLQFQVHLMQVERIIGK